MAEKLIENDENDEIVIIEEPITDERDEEDDDDAQDDRLEAADDEESTDDRERIRERRRAEKLERKQRREEAIKRDKLELNYLRNRNDDLERRISAQETRSFQADLNGIDAQILQAAQEAELAEKVIAKAVEAGNGEDVTQAMRYRDQAIAKVQQLNWQKQQTAQQPPAQQSKVDDLVINYAKEFVEDHPWYDPQGRDEDSSIVMAIDQSLTNAGYDPRSEDYWDELRARVAKRLPDKFEKEERKPRGGPSVGSGREHAPTSTRKEIYISPERKQALIEAGVWDDPVLRAKYVKRYAEYDKQNRA